MRMNQIQDESFRFEIVPLLLLKLKENGLNDESTISKFPDATNKEDQADHVVHGIISVPAPNPQNIFETCCSWILNFLGFFQSNIPHTMPFRRPILFYTYQALDPISFKSTRISTNGLACGSLCVNWSLQRPWFRGLKGDSASATSYQCVETNGQSDMNRWRSSHYAKIARRGTCYRFDCLHKMGRSVMLGDSTFRTGG